MLLLCHWVAGLQRTTILLLLLLLILLLLLLLLLLLVELLLLERRLLSPHVFVGGNVLSRETEDCWRSAQHLVFQVCTLGYEYCGTRHDGDVAREDAGCQPNTCVM